MLLALLGLMTGWQAVRQKCGYLKNLKPCNSSSYAFFQIFELIIRMGNIAPIDIAMTSFSSSDDYKVVSQGMFFGNINLYY